MSTSTLPRVLLVPYLRRWAFDHTARGLYKHLQHRFELHIAYEDEVDKHGELEKWEPDLVVDLWWNGNLYKRFVRVLKQVSSHRWAQQKWGKLTPEQLVKRHCYRNVGIAVPSQRLAELLRGAANGVTQNVYLAPKGYEPAVICDHGIRRGPLVIGWAGRAVGDKRVELIKGAAPDARIADNCLTIGEMSDFYNSLDVIAIASDAEGDPRPLIEGMAAGCFPVTTDVGIVPELVRHGDNGLVVERSVAGFKTAFQWCRDHLEHVRARGRHNAITMRATRTWEHVAPVWGDAIEAALATPTTNVVTPPSMQNWPRRRKPPPKRYVR